MTNGNFRGLGHIAINTRDMDKSIAFYESIGGKVFKRESLSVPGGEKLLTLIEFAGFLLELIQSPAAAPLSEGNIPHFAVYVGDIDKAAAELRAAGVDTFMTPEKNVLPRLFGGLQNWFFTGPSGEQIELLQMD